MKIIYLIAGTYRPAGMERALCLKAGHFAGRGDEVLVVTTDQRGQKSAFDFHPSVRMADLGINYELTNGRPFLVKALEYPLKKWRHRRRLSALLKEERADIVVSMFCNDASFVPSIKDGSRKILELHFSRFKMLQYGRKGLWAVADRWRSRNLGKIASRFDSFVVLTEEDRRYWLEDFPELEGRISLIPNPRTFEPSDIDPFPQKTVLAAGRYCEQKNFAALLDAWSLIPAAERAGWTLRIAGDGPLRESLEEHAAAIGGVQLGPADDIREEYTKASVFALTSHYEGLPMVLLEAQSAGLPIVSFSCKCGPRDVITDGVDGFLVPEGDTAQFAQKLALLMSDSPAGKLRKKMSEAALKSSGRFAPEPILNRWDKLFRKNRVVVVSAVNLRKGGTLQILRQTLGHLSSRIAAGEALKVIALVHKTSLCDFPGIEYIEIPWCTRSWLHRLWAEYVTMHSISKKIAMRRGGDPVDVWLSLHDTTPRVLAKKREVYCHTSFPFLKLKAHDFLMDPKVPLFAMFTKFAYRINVRANDSIIVQQNWFADAMSKLVKVPRDRFRVIPPTFEELTATDCKVRVPTFLFVSTPDCHKNFETLLEASRLLEKEIGSGKFQTLVTIYGTENRYARWLRRKWGNCRSINFAGRIERDKLASLYSSADVFVFPSRIETWGLPISEYASCNPHGRMILADLPYAYETAGNYPNVKYFPPDDVTSLKNIMYESFATR